MRTRACNAASCNRAKCTTVTPGVTRLRTQTPVHSLYSNAAANSANTEMSEHNTTKSQIRGKCKEGTSNKSANNDLSDRRQPIGQFKKKLGREDTYEAAMRSTPS